MRLTLAGQCKGMRVLPGWLPAVALAVFTLVLLVEAAAAQAPKTAARQAPGSEIVLTLDPAQSSVRWTLESALHTVHGTFAVKSGTLHFDPVTGTAGGEIVVDALSGQSGNGSRDKRMHREILETAKYPDAVFHPSRVEGTVNLSGPSDVTLSGIFSIHGSDHELSARVHAELAGDGWHGSSKFEVPYVKWGVKNPSNFLLKVQPVANVEVEMSGRIKAR